MEDEKRSLTGPFPLAGELYRDGEGKMYQIIGRACHSKTKEEMVIYQELYGGYRWFACPFFEFFLEKALAAAEPSIPDAAKAPEKEEEKSQIQEELLLFLDAEDAGEKLAVLRTIRKKLDESLLASIELSLDLIPDERESMERRLDLVERTLEKRVKYEGTRLRSR